MSSGLTCWPCLRLHHLDWKGNSMKGAMTMSNIRGIGFVDRINWMHATCLSRCYPPLLHGHPPPLSGFAHQSIVSPPTPSPGWRQVLTLIQLHQLLLSTEGQPPTQLHFPTAFNLMPFSHGKHIVFHSGFNSIVHILKPAHQFFHDNYITTSLNESKKCPEC